MPPAEILSELERLALRLGIIVRFEPFDPRLAALSAGKGGLCRLRGKPLIVIDAGLSVLDKIAVLSEALATFDLEPIYLPPILRARLERRAPAPLHVAPLPKPRSLARGGATRLPVRPPLRPPVKAVRRQLEP